MFFNSTKKLMRRSVDIKYTLDKQIKERNEYYTKLIADICLSQSNVLSDGTLLIKTNFYGYFSFDDRLLVYWNDDVKKLLLSEGIDSWLDSNNDLIIKLSKNSNSF